MNAPFPGVEWLGTGIYLNNSEYEAVRLCVNCNDTAYMHVDNQCLYGPSKFLAYGTTYLNWYYSDNEMWVVVCSKHEPESVVARRTVVETELRKIAIVRSFQWQTQ